MLCVCVELGAAFCDCTASAVSVLPAALSVYACVAEVGRSLNDCVVEAARLATAFKVSLALQSQHVTCTRVQQESNRVAVNA